MLPIPSLFLLFSAVAVLCQGAPPQGQYQSTISINLLFWKGEFHVEVAAYPDSRFFDLKVWGWGGERLLKKVPYSFQEVTGTMRLSTSHQGLNDLLKEASSLVNIKPQDIKLKFKKASNQIDASCKLTFFYTAKTTLKHFGAFKPLLKTNFKLRANTRGIKDDVIALFRASEGVVVRDVGVPLASRVPRGLTYYAKKRVNLVFWKGEVALKLSFHQEGQVMDVEMEGFGAYKKAHDVPFAFDPRRGKIDLPEDHKELNELLAMSKDVKTFKPSDVRLTVSPDMNSVDSAFYIKWGMSLTAKLERVRNYRDLAF